MRRSHLFAAVATVAVVGLAGITTAVAHDSAKLKVDRLIGVPAGLTGAAQPIRGLAGGGLPWAVGESEVSVKSSGKVEVSFEGLVLAAGANNGSNPIDTMKVVVSCENADGSISNVSTPTFPVTTGLATAGGGNGMIEAKVMLPSPCIAPIVFVTNVADRWFAVDGL